MGVTVKVADHPSKPWSEWLRRNKPASRDDLLKCSCPDEYGRSKRVIESSLSQSLFEDSHISPSKNGFVYAAYHAYSNHHHLVIRPEDIWFAILSQLNFYINAHAEELRSHFVAHDGQKELAIELNEPDFALFARHMTRLLQENIKDPDFRDWIMPTFSTTKVEDRTTAAILMMGSMQAYFSYTLTSFCGLPSATLEGEKADYEDILQRLDKLDELGIEPASFAKLLRPILRNFIDTFDTTKIEQTRDFWTRIAHYEGGSGVSTLSGWLTAFCFWQHNGEPLYFNTTTKNVVANRNHLMLDGVVYPSIEMTCVPNGYAAVPVKVNWYGHVYMTRMVAGSLGMQVSTSKGDPKEELEMKPGAQGRVEMDCVRSLAGWFVYELKENK